jgi:VanZ family protein
VGAVALALLVGSVVPLPRGVDPEFGPYGPDRLLHFLGHAALAAALVDALDGAEGARTAALAVGLSTGYGVCTERLQERVPGRRFEWGDVVAGLLGGVVGASVRRPGSDTGSSGR